MWPTSPTGERQHHGDFSFWLLLPSFTLQGYNHKCSDVDVVSALYLSAMFWMFGHWAAQLTGVCSVHLHWTGHCCTVAHSLEISRLDIQRTRHGHETSTVLMKGPRPENKMWNATFECLIIARLQSSSCGRASSIQPSDCFLACYNLPLPLNLVSFETLAGLRTV